jgi:hypothetical protein
MWLFEQLLGLLAFAVLLFVGAVVLFFLLLLFVGAA